MLKLFNSLSRKIEDFKPINPPAVKMYTCGPTVYQFAHIGNFRAYSTSDVLVRVLRNQGFDVNFVMNITDVGHMTNDDAGGADTGDDKVEKTALKEGKTAREVADFYTEAFLKDLNALNMIVPDAMPRATDNILEQIELIERLQKKGFTYLTNDGVYFDTYKFKNYGQLSSLDEIKEGARVEINTEKRNSRDFALWKFSTSTGSGLHQRQMEWDSPWGLGFPGWHLECSAMSMKYLGVQLDIHTGGVDHKEIHHPNEIAQSEGATGKKFVKYWVHTSFMLAAGQKMSKSLGNTYTVYDLEKEPRASGGSGYDPLALRYLYLNVHYRQEMNFTFEALEAGSNALKKLYSEVAALLRVNTQNSFEMGAVEFEEKFWEAINDDLNLPKALSVAWELLRSKTETGAKLISLYKMDEILGLDLKKGSENIVKEQQIVPEDVKELLAERKKLRKSKRFNESDRLRKKINELGYEIEDNEKGTKVRKK